MNGSPFALFRRNQRQLMVVVTGLAMFSFVFLDAATSRSGEVPVSLGVVTVALICAGGMWIIGSPREKGGEWALYGAIVGAVIAFFGIRAQSNAPVITTNMGTFSRSELQRLQGRRVIANNFMAEASKNRFNVFGGTNEQQIVMRSLHLAEAQKLGISVNDESVNNYIKEITQEKLSRPDYEKILRDLHVGESDLFDILKEELAIQLFQQMDFPPQQRFGQGTVQTPLSLWKAFQMLQVRQSLDTVAVPVSEFVKQIPEPKNSELLAFFDKYKDKRAGENNGSPGFVQERKVQLASVAAEFETFEKLAGEVTEAEVAEYYAKNKERYRVFEVPDSPSNPSEGPSFGEDAPANALEPANVAPPATPEKKNENSPPEPTKPEDGAADESSCGVEDKPAAEEKPAEEAKPAEEKPADVKPTETPAEGAKPAEKKPADAAAPAQPAKEVLTLPPTPGGSPEIVPAAPPKYRELDDTLKAEIQESILKERAFEKMGAAIERALAAMSTLNDEYLRAETAEAKIAAGEAITKKLKAYAEEHGLKYTETSLMTYADLRNAVDEPIAMSMQPSPNPMQPGAMIPDLVFDDDLLFYPRPADAFRGDRRFAYWKIADVPSKVPEFKDVEAQVVEAWKFEMARPLAEKRAKELADLVNTSKKPMSEALTGQTVNNLPDGPAATVHHTSRFTWLNVPRNIPTQFNMQMSEPQISSIDGVDGANNEFMKTVFEDLAVGQTGVAANQLRSAYYVVQVKDRDGVPEKPDDDNLALKALQQQFLVQGRTGFTFDPAFMAMARYPQNEIIGQWQNKLKEKYQIEMPSERNGVDDLEP